MLAGAKIGDDDFADEVERGRRFGSFRVDR
jgi:hypothetical protein